MLWVSKKTRENRTAGEVLEVSCLRTLVTAQRSMGRSPCCSKEGLNRGAWTALEDRILTDYINAHGEGRWRNVPKRAGLKRCGKSCRLRWLNYLRPNIKRGNISQEEEDLIIRLHKLLGNRWSLIAGRLPGRTDNEIKNYWNTNLCKKVQEKNLQNSASSTRSKKTKTLQKPTKSSESDPRVIRTKAVRLTKVFIKPPPEDPIKTEPADQNAAGGSLYGEDSNVDDISALDLLFDFNVDELCLSDLLNGDFSDLRVAVSDENSNINVLSPDLAFSDEMLPDLTAGRGAVDGAQSGPGSISRSHIFH